MTDQDRCLNCDEPIRAINYAMGMQWMHVEPDASFPTERKGTAWRYCRLKVATPKPTDEEGSTIADTCCGKCPGPCYVDQVTGA